MPIPIMRGASDGVPRAIAKDDTVPVDGRADTPPDNGAIRIVTTSDDSARRDVPNSDVEADYRSTVPIRVPGSRPRKQTVEGVGVTGTSDYKPSASTSDSDGAGDKSDDD